MKRLVCVMQCLLLLLGLLLPAVPAYAESIAPTSLTLSVPSGEDADLTAGQTLLLSAVVGPQGASSDGIAWTSDNQACATVDPNGMVTAVSSGLATITASLSGDSSIQDSLVITVASSANHLPVASITLSAEGGATSVAIGDALQIYATVSPTDASDCTYTWSVINDTGAAQIDTSGRLTGMSEGTVTVVATACDDGHVTGTLPITILAEGGFAPASGGTIAVQSITVIDASGEDAVLLGGTLQLTATVLPESATEKSVLWSIDPSKAENAGAATISETGLLTGTAAGMVTARASAKDGSNSSGTRTIMVVDNSGVSAFLLGEPATGVTITSPDNTACIATNKTLQLSATVAPQTAAQTVTWSIESGDTFASVDAAGLVTGIAEGTAVIRAASATENIFATFSIAVVPSYEYVLVLNTNPDPQQEQNTGTLVFGGAGTSSQAGRTSQSYTIASDVQASTTSSGYTVGAKKTIGYTDYVCIGVGEHCFVWMEEGLRTSYLDAGKLDTAATEMIAVYEARPYQALKTLAGGELPIMDGTQKLSILMEQLPSSSGYFAGEDNITAIHIKTPSADDYSFGDLDAFAGLLAHEGQHALFQHFVCGDDAGIEYPLRWINEGLSVAVMDWVWGGDGNGSNGWLSTLAQNTRIGGGESLFYANYRGDSGLDYGLPYLFVRYLTDQAAHKYDPLPSLAIFYKTAFSGNVVNYLNSVVGALGLTDNATFVDALKHFSIAAVVQSGSGVYGFYGDPVISKRVSYPIFDGASPAAYTLPGTGALVLRTKDGVFSAPTEQVGSDIIFVPFNADNSPSAWGGGIGTPDQPYLVNGNSILSAIALNPSGYYRLTEDIDVSDTTIYTIDTFSGTLDGDGHTIKGLHSPLIYQNTGTVCNLKVDLDLDGQFSGYVGGVVGWNTGTVRNVDVSGSFTGKLTGTNPYGWPSVGALVGQNDGYIYECKSNVAMRFTTLPANNIYLGQIAGTNSLSVHDCISAGSISATQSASGSYRLYAGGLVGWLKSSYFASSLKWSYSMTQLSVDAAGGHVCRVGRLVGCEEKTGGYNTYIESSFGVEGLSVAGYAGSAQSTLNDAACLKTDAQLRTQATYVGWDFSDIWSMPVDGGYPVLGGTSGATAWTAQVAKSSYYVGESLDLTNATITNGTKTAAITMDMLYSIPDFSMAGTYQVLGSYDATAFSFPITVSEPATGDVTALSVKTQAKSSYYAGQIFDASGVVLEATIQGTKRTIVSGFTVSKTDALAQTDQQIAYTYFGQTAAQSITVAPTAIVSVVRTNPMTRTAFSGGETLDMSGLTLRLTYSDGTQINGVTVETLAQYGLLLLRADGGTIRAFSATKSLTATDDDGAELYLFVGNSVPNALPGGVYCYAATLTVGNVAYMPDQTLVMHTGFDASDPDEYVWSDPVEDGSYAYETQLISGSLPAGITAIVPDDGTYDFFQFYGKPTAEFNVTLVYRIRDTVQNHSFNVSIRLKAVPMSDECDILSMSLGGVPCIIGADTITVVLPQGSSLTNLMINAQLSAGATQDKINGTRISCTTAQTLTVTSQNGQKSKTYAIHASVATGDALAVPSGVARTDSVVKWTPVAGATGYLVTLMFRPSGSLSDDTVLSAYVTGAQYDMRPVIPKSGRYYLAVQAVDTAGTKPASAVADSSGDLYYCNLTPVAQITVSGLSSIVINQQESYTATVTPANAGATAVQWSVDSGSGTASITSAGVLTGVTAGTVTVKATAQDGSGVYGTLEVTILPVSSQLSVTVDVSGITNPSRALWIDGVCYSGSKLTISGTSYTVNLVDGSATNAVVYSYNSLTETDPHMVYPTNMTVWLLKYQNNAYVVTRAQNFDNLLRYAGSSIRITGTKGIRMITSIATATKNALMSGGIDGYTLLEYGTTVAWKSDLGGESLTLDKSYAKTAYAYKKNVADPVFKQANGLTQYTNVLVGFNNAKCQPDLAMRPYIVLQNAAGQKLTLYGGTIERSIGYIAYQNRAAFAPKTAAYNYIWDIIHYVYSTAYDKEYSK